MRWSHVIATVALAAAEVRAEAPRPWEGHSTPAQRERAHEVFSAGNDHFFRREYAKALERYEAALAIFDHPRIRLATAEVLVVLGRPAEAHAHLEQALRFGAAPFDADEHARALELQATLGKQLGTVVVACTTAGAQLTLDGQPVLTCPGEARRIVMPGRHLLIGKLDGYIPVTSELLVEPAKQVTQQVTLQRLEATAAPVTFTHQRRWTPWKPWAVVAGGVGLALVGVPLRLRATDTLARFRDAVDACGPSGCAGGDPAFDLEARANRQNTAAISLWIAGGAVAVAGLVGVYFNRERLVPAGRSPNLVIAPMLTDTTVGLTIVTTR